MLIDYVDRSFARRVEEFTSVEIPDEHRSGATKVNGHHVERAEADRVYSIVSLGRNSSVPNQTGRIDMDVDLTFKRRAVHRIVRAMNDGACPSCGHIGSREEFTGDHFTGLQCSLCGFHVAQHEINAAQEQFLPTMTKSLGIYKAWENNNCRHPMEEAVDLAKVCETNPTEADGPSLEEVAMSWSFSWTVTERFEALLQIMCRLAGPEQVKADTNDLVDAILFLRGGNANELNLIVVRRFLASLGVRFDLLRKFSVGKWIPTPDRMAAKIRRLEEAQS